MLVAAAERDVSALHGMGDTAVFADEIFGFHTQQAAEKLATDACPGCRVPDQDSPWAGMPVSVEYSKWSSRSGNTRG